MGGLGSGGWYRYDSKPTVEQVRSIHTTRWVRAGIIGPPGLSVGSWLWKDKESDEVLSAISYTVETFEGGSGVLTLRYRVSRTEEDFDYRVRLVTTLPHLGGLRWWFVCPIIKNDVPCRRRV